MASQAPAGEPREAFALPPGCEEGYVEANGTRLHYVAAGAGPLAVLLHGFPEFWYSWRWQLPALAERFRVVAPDLRGYNLSDKPRYGYDIDTLSTDIGALIAALGAEQADVVGHDWGGIIAWALAIRDPGRVRRLAILNAPHPALTVRTMRHPTQALRSSYVAFFQLRGVAERALERDDYAYVRRTFRAADRGRAWLSDTDIERYVAAIRRPGALGAALEYYRQLRPRYLHQLGPMRVIEAPTLVLWGELDPYVGPRFLDGLGAWVRDLRIQRFPTSGHWLHQQEPQRVNQALLTFLG
jgi:epoxide hydrolase 4